MHNRMQSEITVERAITTGIFILLGVAIFCVSLLAGFTMAENKAKDNAIEWQVALNWDLKERNIQLTTASDIGSIFSFMFPDLRARVSEMNHRLQLERNKKGLKDRWGMNGNNSPFKRMDKSNQPNNTTYVYDTTYYMQGGNGYGPGRKSSNTMYMRAGN